MGVSEKTGKAFLMVPGTVNPKCMAGFPRRAQSPPALCNPMDCSQPGFSSMGFSRHIYWSGLPFPPSRNLPNPGIKPKTPGWQAESLPLCRLRRPVHGVTKSPTTEQAPTQAHGACYNVVATRSGKQTHSEGQSR